MFSDRGSRGSVTEPAESSSSESAVASEATSVAVVSEGGSSEVELAVVVHFTFEGIETAAVGGGDDGALFGVGVPHFGEVTGDDHASFGVEIGGVVVGAAFDDDGEGSTAHASSDFEEMVLAVTGEFGGFTDEVVLIDDEVGGFGVGFHRMVVRAVDAAEGVAFGDGVACGGGESSAEISATGCPAATAHTTGRDNQEGRGGEFPGFAFGSGLSHVFPQSEECASHVCLE